MMIAVLRIEKNLNRQCLRAKKETVLRYFKIVGMNLFLWRVFQDRLMSCSLTLY